MINARETCKKWIQVLMINCIVSSFVRAKILFIFCWNSIPCIKRKKIFLSQNFLSCASPHTFISLFLSIILQNTWKPTNMKQADETSINKITLYKFLFQIYIYTSYHSLFSILSEYGCLGYWELQNILQLPLIVPQLHNFLKEVSNKILETLQIRFLFLIIYC